MCCSAVSGHVTSCRCFTLFKDFKADFSIYVAHVYQNVIVLGQKTETFYKLNCILAWQFGCREILELKNR